MIKTSKYFKDWLKFYDAEKKTVTEFVNYRISWICAQEKKENNNAITDFCAE